MNHAGNTEFIIWLIVAIVAIAAKGLGKLATPPEKAEPATQPHPQPKPPVRRPTPRPLAEVAPSVAPAAIQPAKLEPPTPPPAAAIPPTQPSRSTQWAMALRDRKNIRNVIIANEIIGRPVSLREL